MDNIILGLLLLHNRTIYQLRERIEKGLHLMYSSSMGSIQAAVKKLLRCGYISYEEVVENGKYRKDLCNYRQRATVFFGLGQSPYRGAEYEKPGIGESLFYGLL